MAYGFCPDKSHQQVSREYSSGMFSGDGPIPGLKQSPCLSLLSNWDSAGTASSSDPIFKLLRCLLFLLGLATHTHTHPGSAKQFPRTLLVSRILAFVVPTKNINIPKIPINSLSLQSRQDTYVHYKSLLSMLRHGVTFKVFPMLGPKKICAQPVAFQVPSLSFRFLPTLSECSALFCSTPPATFLMPCNLASRTASSIRSCKVTGSFRFSQL